MRGQTPLMNLGRFFSSILKALYSCNVQMAQSDLLQRSLKEITKVSESHEIS